MEIYYFRTDLLGVLSKWIISQSPIFPQNLVDILNAASAYLDEHPIGESIIEGMFKCDSDKFRDSIETMCKAVPEIEDLNLSKHERDKGVEVNDEARNGFSFTSRYGSIKKEHDFVDLGALARNIFMEFKKEQETTNAIGT